MADNFSLDDILAEIDAKKAERSNDTPKSSGNDFSVTSIIGRSELDNALKAAEEHKTQAAFEKEAPVFADDGSHAANTEYAAAKEEKPAPRESEEKQAEEIQPAHQAKEEPVLVAKNTGDETKNAGEKAEPVKLKAEKPVKNVSPDTQQRRLIDRQLKAEESFDDPDELIDAINPYEVKSKAADMSTVLSGDTKGLAGNELKKLASAKETKEVKLYKPENQSENAASIAPATIETTAPVKKYIPQNQQEQPRKLTEKERRSNEALLEKLNKAIARDKTEEEEKRRTLTDSHKLEGIRSPTQGLNIDYDSRVIMATGVLPDNDALLKGKSRRKLRDFVMDGDSDEGEEDEESFESYDATGQIWSDLCESHKVLKIRFVFLLIITVFMTVTALLGDFNKSAVFNLFGVDITFLDRRADVQGFLFYNLIMGVISVALCSSVVFSGITKLFKLKADCDSVCAVTAVVALVTAAINLVRSDDVLLSYAFVYIPAAIAGLMFNTLGKLVMINRAKRNFRFVSGDSAKYSAMLIEGGAADALTKGVAGELPCLAAMRKTELLTDFLKSSYCEDKADRISRRLVPAALAVSVLIAAASYFIPYGTAELQNNIYRALTVLTGLLTVLTPFSMMLVVNVPLTRAGRGLEKTDSVVLGYGAAEEFSDVNSVMTDASLLFPAGTVVYSNIKHCRQPNSVNNIALDQAIILAASLAIKSGSVMSGMFKDMINDKDDILAKIENCVYEDNMGVLGWFGNKRLIMGSRDQMKHHDIKVPDIKKVNKYASENTETIYLSVGGEVVIMFFVELLANPEVKNCLQRLTDNGVSVVIKTTDSIVTVSKIAEVFDIPPEQIRILPYSMHEQFSSFTRYTSRGSGAVSCNGTFTGLSNALLAAKKLMKDISIGTGMMLGGVLLSAVCAAAAALTGNTYLLSPSLLIGWNLAWTVLTLVAESLRKY